MSIVKLLFEFFSFFLFFSSVFSFSVFAFDGEELEWFLKFLYNEEYNTIV